MDYFGVFTSPISQHSLLLNFFSFCFLFPAFFFSSLTHFPACQLRAVCLISSRDLRFYFFRPFVRAHCDCSWVFFFFFCSYFSFIMVILWFSVLLSPPASCWNITFMDEMSRFLTDLNANLISPSPFCPTCATLVSIYCPEERGFVCLTNFLHKSILLRSFSDMQMGQGNLGQTNSFSCCSLFLLMINTLFSCFKPFQPHLNISGNHL